MERMIRKKRVLKYRGSIVDIYDDSMEAPDGALEQWDYVEHRLGAAAVLPVLPDGRLVFVRQYRPAVEMQMLEIPAGSRNSKDEEPVHCAARELEEETGYRSSSLSPLATICTTPAFCNEKIEIFLARGLQKTAQHLDAHEFLNIEIHSLPDAVTMVLGGEIKDAKTVSAVLAYYALETTVRR